VAIPNVGNRFSGNYFVTSAVHTYSNRGGYTTTFTACGSQAWTLLDLLQPKQESRNWVCIGKVTDNKDPDNLGRVKVVFPWLDDAVESDWARMVAPAAGKDQGFFALPAVEDEVLVTFEQGDVNRPYVLGSLWNGKDAPPLRSDNAVDGNGLVVQRVWRSRSGHTILLDDSEGDENVRIVSEGALQIDTQGDVIIKAGGKIAMTGGDGIEIGDDTSNVQIKGKRIDLN
ncbi:MAG: hypothetical protein KDE31_31175, partial [Caldilineaceae bacterium]|nr:hypothetical protein [Caldilineaceae bacterium]